MAASQALFKDTVRDFLAFSLVNPSSLRNCIQVARENARSVRTALTSEMWEALNGAWLDCGMYMQNVMVLARAHGLETCPQQIWCEVGHVARSVLGIADNHVLLSGMSMGHADPDAPENEQFSVREPAAVFTTVHR